MKYELTDDEKKIAQMLGACWNEFLKLPKEHPCDQDEFCRYIHSAQEKVMMRSGRRQIMGDN